MELQEVAGGKKKKDAAVSWMYEVPLSNDAATQEEHLLGKEVTSLEDGPSEMEKLGEHPGSLWMNGAQR